MKLFNKKAQAPKLTAEELKAKVLADFARLQERAKNLPSNEQIIFNTK